MGMGVGRREGEGRGGGGRGEGRGEGEREGGRKIVLKAFVCISSVYVLRMRIPCVV